MTCKKTVSNHAQSPHVNLWDFFVFLYSFSMTNHKNAKNSPSQPNILQQEYFNGFRVITSPPMNIKLKHVVTIHYMNTGKYVNR